MFTVSTTVRSTPLGPQLEVALAARHPMTINAQAAMLAAPMPDRMLDNVLVIGVRTPDGQALSPSCRDDSLMKRLTAPISIGVTPVTIYQFHTKPCFLGLSYPHQLCVLYRHKPVSAADAGDFDVCTTFSIPQDPG